MNEFIGAQSLQKTSIARFKAIDYYHKITYRNHPFYKNIKAQNMYLEMNMRDKNKILEKDKGGNRRQGRMMFVSCSQIRRNIEIMPEAIYRLKLILI